MKKEIEYFESAKADNTEKTFELALNRAKETGINKIVLASTTGQTAIKAMDYFTGKNITLVVVPHQNGFSSEENLFPEETMKLLRDKGHEVHVGTMLFHTDKLYGSTVPMVIANFLRIFCEGVKVCVEITLMATDGGCLKAGEEVIAIAGTGKNADTALVMEASTTRHLEHLKINEILCKPLNRL